MTDHDQATNAAQLQQALRHFTGTEHWYRHPMFRTYLYTDGVQYLAEQAGAYWLIDAIFACQTEPRVKHEPFQVWTLTVNDDRSAVLACTDGNTHPVYRQEFSYTDFPLKQQTLYLTNDVLLLPSEY